VNGRFFIVVPLLVFSAASLGSPLASAAGPSAAGAPKGAAVLPASPAAPAVGGGAGAAGSVKQGPGPTAAEHLRRAAKARRAGRWAEAADAYRAAYELEPRPEIAGDLGVCEMNLGRHRDAAEHLLMNLENPAGLPEEQRRRFEEAQDRAEREVATVAIGANPTTAEVFVDERSLGAPRDTYIVFLDPGPHTFRARLPGYDDAVSTLDATPGAALQVSLLLREHRPPPVAPPIVPVVRCRAGVDCGGRVTTTLRYVGFATAGAALVAGAGMAISGEVLDAELNQRVGGRALDTCSGRGTLQLCRDLTELRNTRDILASGAVLGFVTAGVVGAVTVSSFWWAPAPRSAARIGIAPATSSGQIGARVLGYW